MYNGSEAVGTVEVCAVSSAELSRTVSVGIGAGPGGTAQGQNHLGFFRIIRISLHSVISDGLDYQLPQGLLEFSAGNQRACITIELTDDLTVEGEELFTVTLTSTDQRITLKFNSADISIADNSGRPLCCICVYVTIKLLIYKPMQMSALSSKSLCTVCQRSVAWSLCVL